MTHTDARNRLDRPVDERYDHVLGPSDAQITLVEYGSYACPHCRAANERIAELRDRFGDRMRYVFRQRPLTGNELAERAALLVEQADTPARFWDAHMRLMSRSETLTEADLEAVAAELGLSPADPERVSRARERVEADRRSAASSGVMYTPTFFINGRRYDGPWDESSFEDAMLGSLGHRVRAAALDFARWAPSAGVLLLLASVLAVALSNSPFAERFESFWERPWGFIFGEWTFRMSLRDWIDEGLLTVFFLVVGLEIKREFTTGSLASRRSAALPIAGAVGGMTLPALIYISLLPSGPWAHGWGVPIATDTAFAIALVAAMGRRVPIELRIFLTAAAIVDDIGAIVVVALFYAGAIDWSSLAGAALLVGVLALLNSARVYRVAPYVLTGVALWACVHASGLHSTLAGVLLAVFIPTRPPPDFRTLSMQADAILMTEARRGTEILRRGPSEPAMRALDAIHDRLESPADRMLRLVGPNSTYLVLPLFALANAGVALEADVFSGHGPLMLAIVLGLTIGKPLGITLACLAAARLGIAVKPDAYSWRQLLGAGALAGIGFTMSLFIAAQAFPMRLDFEAAKVAVFSASVLSVLIGVGLLWSASEPEQQTATAMRPARVTPDSASEPSS